MTKAAISAVEAMAKCEGQLLIKGGVPQLKWRPNASVEDFFEGDIESADDYENFAEDIFDPTEPDNNAAEELDDYDNIESLNDDDVGVPDNGKVSDPANLEPDPDDFVPDGLNPDAGEGAKPHDDPGGNGTGDNTPNATNIAHNQRSVEANADEDSGPIGTMLGGTEADPTVTDSTTKWMIP
jgi:hypothetical protein